MFIKDGSLGHLGAQAPSLSTARLHLDACSCITLQLTDLEIIMAEYLP